MFAISKALAIGVFLAALCQMAQTMLSQEHSNEQLKWFVDLLNNNLVIVKDTCSQAWADPSSACMIARQRAWEAIEQFMIFIRAYGN